jgi:hypothetical protein
MTWQRAKDIIKLNRGLFQPGHDNDYDVLVSVLKLAKLSMLVAPLQINNFFAFREKP